MTPRKLSTTSHTSADSRLFDKPSRYTLDPDIPIEEETLQNNKPEALILSSAPRPGDA